MAVKKAAENSAIETDISNREELRYSYIEIAAFYVGVVSNRDLQQAFNLSPPAASNTIRKYKEVAPDNLAYSTEYRGHVPTANFKAKFADLSPAAVLPQLESIQFSPVGTELTRHLSRLPHATLPFPQRFPTPNTLAVITRAIMRDQIIEVSYQSLGQNPQSRRIRPHALVNTGVRWHLRGYDYANTRYGDFVLSRFTKAKFHATTSDEYGQENDQLWQEEIKVNLIAHPKLSESHRATIEYDYGMKGGMLPVKLRKALVPYLLIILNVDYTPDNHFDPKRYQLALANVDEVEPLIGWLLAQ